jgi:hypothetical protein
MGINALFIESDCYWGKIKEDWTGEKYLTSFKKVETPALSAFKLKKLPHEKSCSVKKNPMVTYVKSDLTPVALPDNHFWGDFNGRN